MTTLTSPSTPAAKVLDHLIETGAARPRPLRPGIARAMAAGPIEVAVAERSTDTFMRARWREWSRASPGARHLLIAADPDHPDRVRALGPTSAATAPIRSVPSDLLADTLQHAARLPPLDAVRRLADDLARMGGDGLNVHGLLTRHTLEHRFKGDPDRWNPAQEQVRRVNPTDPWRQVMAKLGYAVQQLPIRGHLARWQGKPAVVVHPKRQARDLARVDEQGRPPEGLLLQDCDARGARYGILAQGGRYRLFDARSATPASQWLELDIRLLGRDRLPFAALLSPPFLAEGGFAALRSEARNFGVALHERLDRTIRQEVEVVDRTEEEARAYAARLADADETLLEESDEAGAAQSFSGEALRAELRRELEEGRGEELTRLPWGIGAAFRQGPDACSTGPPGVFFACRAKGERYWRYVDGAGVIADPAPILRRIDPGHAPGVDDPPIDLEAAWQAAVASIVEEHNAQVRGGAGQSLGAVQRWALEVLGNPDVAVPPGAAAAYDALSVGRSQAVRRALGDVKRQVDAGELGLNRAAAQIMEVVTMFGLRKVEDAPEREEITPDDVGVVCWMGVLAG